MKQIRLPIEEVSHNVNSIVAGLIKWEDVVAKYGLFEFKGAD